MNNIIKLNNYKKRRDEKMKNERKNAEFNGNGKQLNEYPTKAKWLLEALFQTDDEEKCENMNDDTDFGKVLERFYDNKPKTRKIRYSDGVEHTLTFSK